MLAARLSIRWVIQRKDAHLSFLHEQPPPLPLQPRPKDALPATLMATLQAATDACAASAPHAARQRAAFRTFLQKLALRVSHALHRREDIAAATYTFGRFLGCEEGFL